MFVAILLLCFMLVTGVQPEFVSFTTGSYLALLFLASLPAHFFTQRFFLDRRREWGLHLRARLLHVAKWPRFLQALVETLLGHERPYSLTPKVKMQKEERMLLWPHLLISGAVATAWVIGVLAGHGIHPLLHGGAALTVALSLGIVWTERWSYPEPYDRALQRKSGAGGMHPEHARVQGAPRAQGSRSADGAALPLVPADLRAAVHGAPPARMSRSAGAAAVGSARNCWMNATVCRLPADAAAERRVENAPGCAAAAAGLPFAASSWDGKHFGSLCRRAHTSSGCRPVRVRIGLPSRSECRAVPPAIVGDS